MLPVTTITFAMTQDTEIHLLRQFTGGLNDTGVEVSLTYCNWSTMPYAVTGRKVDGEQFSESYWTQDEAEQAYIFHAAEAVGAMQQMILIHNGQMTELQAKINGERTPGPNYSCVPDDAYVDPIVQRETQELLKGVGL